MERPEDLLREATEAEALAGLVSRDSDRRWLIAKAAALRHYVARAAAQSPRRSDQH